MFPISVCDGFFLSIKTPHMQNKNIQNTVKREGIRPKWTGTLGMVERKMDSENQVGFVTKIQFSIFLMNIFSRNHQIYFSFK
jgi:hypothetical protein